jgi:hypothetical protein
VKNIEGRGGFWDILGRTEQDHRKSVETADLRTYIEAWTFGER